jgi:hypothetical protein
MRDFEYLYDLFPLDHSPMRPYPRKNHAYEAIFASMWKAFMHKETRIDEPREINFADVMSHFGYTIEQRHASVVASIVCWFGTNCGDAFLRESDEFGKCLSTNKFQYRYMLNWTMENMRLSYVNHAQRVIELCTGQTGLDFTLTPADFEAVDCLMRWLGTADGQMFLSLAREECDAEMKRERIRKHAEWERQRVEWKERNGSTDS